LIAEIGRINLSDTTNLVRDGNSEIGPPGSGKDNYFDILCDARTDTVPDGDTAGTLFAETIGKNQSSLQIQQSYLCTLNKVTVDGSRSDAIRTMRFEFQVTDLGAPGVELKLVDGINTQATNYNTILDWDADTSNTIDPATDVPTLSEPSYTVADSSTMGMSWDVYDPNNDISVSQVYFNWEFGTDFGGDFGSFTADPDNGRFSVDAQHSYSDGEQHTFSVEMYDQQGGTKIDSDSIEVTVGSSGGNNNWV
jgi:hypothetical protein